jgi:hypothetical protein
MKNLSSLLQIMKVNYRDIYKDGEKSPANKDAIVPA